MEGEGIGYTPSFFKVLLRSSFKRMLIPRDFTNHIREDSSRDATIINDVGRPWQVKIHEDKGDMYFDEGWEAVVKENELEEGFFLLIFYQGNMVFTMTVYDLSGCEKSYYPDTTDLSEPKGKKEIVKKNMKRWRAGIPVQEKSKERTMKYFCPMKPNRFEATIHYTDLQWKQLNIPMAFKEANGFQKDCDVTLIDPSGTSYPVCLRFCTQQGIVNYRAVFGMGWRAFAENNKLGLGDRCIFKLLSKEKGIFKVKIHRSEEN